MTWYRPLLKAMADRELDLVLRSKVDASDVVQDTCKVVVRGFHGIQARSSCQFWAYLRTVLRHKLEDTRRKFKRSAKRSIYREESLSYTNSQEQRDLSDVVSQPIDRLVNSETCERVRLALGRLPRELQRLLRWRFRKGMTYNAIGAKVDRSEDDVRMLIKRCLLKIKAEVCLHESSN